VGQIAASPAAHQDLNAGFVVLFEDDDTVIATGRTQPPSRDSTGHQSGGTSPDHRDVHADASNEQVPKSDLAIRFTGFSTGTGIEAKGSGRGDLAEADKNPARRISCAESPAQNLLRRISLAQSPHPKPPEGGIRRGPLFAKPKRSTEPITKNVLPA
jgi:hypothetical protein